MVTSRPFMRKTSSELAEMFEGSRGNLKELRELLKELKHRATPSATALRKKVEAAINGEAPPSGNRPPKSSKEVPSHHTVLCRQCQTNLRIPVPQGAVAYTCPTCKAEFEVSLNNELIQVTWVEKVKTATSQEVQMSDATARSVLGVAPTATFSEIKLAWRKASQQYHPDKHQTLPERLRAAAEVEMQKINEAYRYLERFTADEF
jgi:hypothetical protein